MHGRPVGANAARVALHPGIGEVVVQVAIEHLMPVAGQREAQFVAVIIEGGLAEAEDNHDVAAHARHPSVEGQYPVMVVRGIDGDRLRAQGVMPASQPDQVSGEAMEVAHMAVVAL